MKKWFIFLTLILLISFGSAQYYGYENFSFSDLLDEIDSTTMILGAVFIISFALLNFALSRTLKQSRGTAGVIAFAIAFSIIYGLNKYDLDVGGLFYNIGISEGILSTIIPIILLIGVIYFLVKLKRMAVIIFGLLLIGLGFTNIIYEKGLITIVGIILLLGGIFVGRKKSPKTQQHQPQIIRRPTYPEPSTN